MVTQVLALSWNSVTYSSESELFLTVHGLIVWLLKIGGSPSKNEEKGKRGAFPISSPCMYHCHLEELETVDKKTRHFSSSLSFLGFPETMCLFIATNSVLCSGRLHRNTHTKNSKSLVEKIECASKISSMIRLIGCSCARTKTKTNPKMKVFVRSG